MTQRANVDEVAAGIYRINVPMPPEFIPGGFSFNQYLVAGDAPLLFHTGLRRLFPLVRDAVQSVLPLERLRYIGLSHFEADECGALNEWLAAAPNAVPVCSRVAAMTSIGDQADRDPMPLGDGDELDLGSHTVRWLDAPHLPHGWECGYMFESGSRTLLCGDLFTQPGTGDVAITESDILEPSEALRSKLEYYSHAPNTRALLEHLAGTAPRTLACMHGSAWSGDGAALLRALADRLET